jgi:UDP-N-acetylmuramoyl-tripeptide--D-alanyl-D-alanine ligase
MVKGSLGSRMAVIVEALENLHVARQGRASHSHASQGQATQKRVVNGH